MNFETFLNRPQFAQHSTHFKEILATRSSVNRHGDLPTWLACLTRLPEVEPTQSSINTDTITIGTPSDLNSVQSKQLQSALTDLSPWRKGPFQFFDTLIDTEWRSDWKWQRVAPHISSLQGRQVLDVGCGTGYHGWRILGEGADYVLGIDPSMRFFIQHSAVQRYLQHSSFDFLPLGIEDMPTSLTCFDSVFSMGVLYHRRRPINHLVELKNLLEPGGELILETLIVDQAPDGLLQPTNRYAQMRNVWSIMTVDKILALLDEAGFQDAVCVDQNTTSLDEQRRTPWMQFHSLQDFLDPGDISKTIEGYPAPKRGIFIAQR